MWKNECKKFIRWAKEKEKGKGLLVHFYIKKKSERYEPPDFFILNMLFMSREIFMKGTTGHGVKYKDRPCEVPVLNFFEVNGKFYDAIKEYYKNRGSYQKYQYAIILDKRKMGGMFRLVMVKDISEATGRIGPRNCHHYDVFRSRVGSFQPFNYCGVTRAEVKSDRVLRKPIARIPTNFLIGIMVPKEEKRIFRELLKQKGLTSVEVFAL